MFQQETRKKFPITVQHNLMAQAKWDRKIYDIQGNWREKS